MTMTFRYHIFLAYARPDRRVAEMLYREFVRHFRVFMAARDLLPGDAWDEEIPKAQAESLLTLVLVSLHTKDAFYQREEIAAAIRLAREGSHRVVPMYLDDDSRSHPPYGFERLQALTVDDTQIGCEPALRKLKDLIAAIRAEADTVGSGCGAAARATRASPMQAVTDDSNGPDRHPWFGADEPWVDLAQPAIDKQFLEYRLWDLARLHRDKKWRLSLIYADVDGITLINSRYGPPLGDLVIAEVDRLLKKASGRHYVTRCGKDEFLVTLEGCDIKVAHRVASRIAETVRHYDWNKLVPGLYVSSCCGVSELADGEPLIDWVMRGILGLRQAKKEGRGSVSVAPGRLPPEPELKRDLRYWSRS